MAPNGLVGCEDNLSVQIDVFVAHNVCPCCQLHMLSTPRIERFCACPAGDLPVKDVFMEQGLEVNRLCIMLPKEVRHFAASSAAEENEMYQPVLCSMCCIISS